MSKPRTPEDIAAKEAFMNAYFDNALDRVVFVERLAAEHREVESLTLCLVYIDRFAQLLSWPRTETGRNFVETLCSHDHGGFLSCVHPLQLVRAFDAMNQPWPSRARALEGRYPSPPYSLMRSTEASNVVCHTFACNEVAEIVRELWRGTIAAVAYYWMRNPAVHGFGGSQDISFDETIFDGQPAPDLSLQTLLPPLRAMIIEARKRSLDKCEWFGDDRVLQRVR